jgi:hypothetical protein
VVKRAILGSFWGHFGVSDPPEGRYRQKGQNGFLTLFWVFLILRLYEIRYIEQSRVHSSRFNGDDRKTPKTPKSPK